MKYKSRLLILNRLCTKIGCKYKKNKILEEYFKDKREELNEYKPKTYKQYIFWKIWKEIKDIVKPK